MELRDYFNILRRRWLVALIAFVAVLGGWLALGVTQEKFLYHASVNTFQAQLNPQEYAYTRTLGEVALPPYIPLAQRRDFAQAMTTLNKTVALLQQKRTLQEQTWRDSVELNAHPDITVDYLRSHLETEVIEKDSKILIHATAADAATAIDIANAMAWALKDSLRDFASANIDRTIAYVKEAIFNPALQRRDREKEEFLTRKRNFNAGELHNIEKQLDIYSQQVVQLSHELVRQEGFLAGLKSRQNDIQQQIQDLIQGKEKGSADLPETPEMKELQARLQLEQVHLKELELSLTKDHPSVLDAQKRLAYLQEMLKKETKKLEASKPRVFLAERKKELARELTQLEKDGREKAAEKERTDQEIQRLKAALGEAERRHKTLKELEDALTLQGKKLDEAESEVKHLQKDLDSFEQKKRMLPDPVIVENPARSATLEASHNVHTQLPMVIILACVIALASAYFLDYADDRVKSTYDIKRYLNLPVLGAVPLIENERELLIKDVALRAPMFEVYGRIGVILNRTERDEEGEIQQAPPSAGGRCFVVLSVSEQEGKSTIVANLATAVARMGKQTVLIDADMRRPVLHRFFNVHNASGLSTYLSGKWAARAELQRITEEPSLATPSVPQSGTTQGETTNVNEVLSEMMKPTAVENLYVIPSGPIPGNPVALLESDRMKQLLAYLKERFDFVLLDAPPIESTADPLVLAGQADSTLWIVSAWSTKKYSLTWGKRMLKGVGARIGGIILNKASTALRSYYYYYYETKGQATER